MPSQLSHVASEAFGDGITLVAAGQSKVAIHQLGCRDTLLPSVSSLALDDLPLDIGQFILPGVLHPALVLHLFHRWPQLARNDQVLALRFVVRGFGKKLVAVAAQRVE